MLIPPKYTLSPKITSILNSIEASKAVIDGATLSPQIETNIRRTATLQSSLFSARVEGNTTLVEELSVGSKTQKKAEIFNILRALEFLRLREKKDFTSTELLSLHKIVMKGLHPDGGKFRTEPSATFNSQGIAIYMHPPPKFAAKYMLKLFKYINSEKEILVPVKAVLAHYVFEKIHPFLDGNGRVGRLILQKVMMQGGYGMKGMLTIEEFLDNHRSEYYRSLEEPDKDATDYVEFMLTAIAEAARKAEALIKNTDKNDPANFLLPRRGEILRIVRDHSMVNLDSLKRRFPNINPRTLRHDTGVLVKMGLIKKLGTTKGVYYTTP